MAYTDRCEGQREEEELMALSPESLRRQREEEAESLRWQREMDEVFKDSPGCTLTNAS